MIWNLSLFQVNNFIGRGKLYVCVVTVPESPGERPKVHPYRLAGPYADGNNGFYERDIEIDESQNTFEWVKGETSNHIHNHNSDKYCCNIASNIYDTNYNNGILI